MSRQCGDSFTFRYLIYFPKTKPPNGRTFDFTHQEFQLLTFT